MSGLVWKRKLRVSRRKGKPIYCLVTLPVEFEAFEGHTVLIKQIDVRKFEIEIL